MDRKKGDRPTDPQSLRDALRHSPLGRWLDERQTGLVLDTGRLAEMRAGDVLFREGDEIRHVPFVLSGEVKLVKMGPQGREYVLHLTRGGAFPDPGALFYEAPLPATAVALGPGRLLWLERATMTGCWTRIPGWPAGSCRYWRPGSVCSSTRWPARRA